MPIMCKNESCQSEKGMCKHEKGMMLVVIIMVLAVVGWKFLG